jgi:pantetheine-phosphate adenylyltransferase
VTGQAIRAIYPGTFDPVTNGHLDLVRRAAGMCSELVVAVLRNTGKEPLFDAEERRAMFAEALAGAGPAGVRVVAFDGLLADYARAERATVVVRGLRAISDFEYELQMAQMNNALTGIPTLFLPTASRHSFLASRLLREVAQYGGDVTPMVPPAVARALAQKFKPTARSEGAS